MDLLGQTLEGGFGLERLIAEGRNSQVYEAERHGTPRRVAVKLLHPALADDPRHTSRFRYEGDVLRRLRHRHAVDLLESVQASGGHCFHVLELLEGEPLRRCLDNRGPLPPVDAARVVRQAAGALQTLHDLGVAHRDVQPSNLFLAVQGSTVNLKLLDLGKALDLGDLQRGHEVVGSRGYISPEQLRGEVHETTAATDIFALAVVAYESLCGRRPFEADDDQDLLYEISSGSFPSLSGRVEGLSRQVDTVLSRAMHPDRDQRHHSIETFADELVDALGCGVDRGVKRVGSDTAKMKAVPAPEEPPATSGASIPVDPPAEVASPDPPRRPRRQTPRVPVPPVPDVIPGLPLVAPSAEPVPDAAPAIQGTFLEDKTTVDAVPPVPAPQPVQRITEPVPPQSVQPAAPQPVPPQPVQPAAPQPVQPQPGPPAATPPREPAPYVPTPGATPYVPPAIPHEGVTAGPAGPPPDSHVIPHSSSAAPSGGASVALIVIPIVVGIVGLGLLVALYMYLR